MSLKQLEQSVLGLSPEERRKFANWFETHRDELIDDSADDFELSEEQKAELLRRKEMFLADPSIATPWEGTIEKIRKQLHARRAQKAAA